MVNKKLGSAISLVTLGVALIGLGVFWQHPADVPRKAALVPSGTSVTLPAVASASWLEVDTPIARKQLAQRNAQFAAQQQPAYDQFRQQALAQEQQSLQAQLAQLESTLKSRKTSSGRSRVQKTIDVLKTDAQEWLTAYQNQARYLTPADIFSANQLRIAQVAAAAHAAARQVALLQKWTPPDFSRYEEDAPHSDWRSYYKRLAAQGLTGSIRALASSSTSPTLNASTDKTNSATTKANSNSNSNLNPIKTSPRLANSSPSTDKASPTKTAAGEDYEELGHSDQQITKEFLETGSLGSLGEDLTKLEPTFADEPELPKLKLPTYTANNLSLLNPTSKSYGFTSSHEFTSDFFVGQGQRVLNSLWFVLPEGKGEARPVVPLATSLVTSQALAAIQTEKLTAQAEKLTAQAEKLPAATKSSAETKPSAFSPVKLRTYKAKVTSAFSYIHPDLRAQYRANKPEVTPTLMPVNVGHLDQLVQQLAEQQRAQDLITKLGLAKVTAKSRDSASTSPSSSTSSSPSSSSTNSPSSSLNSSSSTSSASSAALKQPAASDETKLENFLSADGKLSLFSEEGEGLLNSLTLVDQDNDKLQVELLGSEDEFAGEISGSFGYVNKYGSMKRSDVPSLASLASLLSREPIVVQDYLETIATATSATTSATTASNSAKTNAYITSSPTSSTTNLNAAPESARLSASSFASLANVPADSAYRATKLAASDLAPELAYSNRWHTPGNPNYTASQLANSATVLRVGFVQAPQYFLSDSGATIGLDYELLESFAKWWGVKVEYQKFSNTNELFAALRRGSVDLAAGHLGNFILVPEQMSRQEAQKVQGQSAQIQSAQGQSVQEVQKVQEAHNQEAQNQGASASDSGISIDQIIGLNRAQRSTVSLPFQNEYLGDDYQEVPVAINYPSLPVQATLPYLQEELVLITYARHAATKTNLPSKSDLVYQPNNANYQSLTSYQLASASWDENQLIDQVGSNKLKYALVRKTSARWLGLLYPALRILELPKPVKVQNLFYVNNANLGKLVNVYFQQQLKTQAFANMHYNNFLHLKDLPREPKRLFMQAMQEKYPLYVGLIKKYSLNMDYRLVMALTYQESRWTPDAVSPWGPSGFMMLTNRSAEVLGVTDKLDVVQSIREGTKLLMTFKNNLADEITGYDRDMFAVSNYNLGIAKILDGRRWLAEHNLQTDSWAVLAQNYPRMSDATHKYGKLDGELGRHYIENIRQWYYMILNYIHFYQQWHKQELVAGED